MGREAGCSGQSLQLSRLGRSPCRCAEQLVAALIDHTGECAALNADQHTGGGGWPRRATAACTVGGLTPSEALVCNAGMANMTHRTTFALDDDTVRRLKSLSARWKVSQTEVVRRALNEAELRIDAGAADVIAALERYHAEAACSKSAADDYLAQARSDRKRWRAE